MDLATFQWLAGLAFGAILMLVGWIARDMKEKIKDAAEDNDKLGGRVDAKIALMSAEDTRLREAMDLRSEKLHERINSQAKEIADLRETVAGFQATFMTREEHGRYCQTQK